MQALNEHLAKDGFRLRGTAMSRVDGFSDVVFGFALTLIVVSLEVPRTYDELHAIILGFFPFSICFVFLITIWWAHFRFFRRYGLHDPLTIFINCGLLFTLLFYVYPLKFLFTMAIYTHANSNVFSNPLQTRELMIVYGLGFAAIYFCLAALYWNAWRMRKAMHLSPLEITLTLSDLWGKFGVGCVGLICSLIARLLPPEYAGQSGWFFFLTGVWSTVHGFIAGNRIRAARTRTTPEDLLPLPHVS